MIIVALIILYYLHIPLSKVLSAPLTAKIGHVIKDLVIELIKDFKLLFQFVKDILSGNK